MEKFTFSNEVIEELIKLTKNEKMEWFGNSGSYGSQIGIYIFYLHIIYDDSSHSKEVKLCMGNKCTIKKIYSYKDEKKCKLIDLVKAVKESLENTNKEEKEKYNIRAA
jgi:hypothetical protein